jgi:choline dehydrogenase
VSGPDHEDVVDSQPRVDELRTVDCSALPTMLAGNVDGPHYGDGVASRRLHS